MEFKRTFIVNKSVEETWEVLGNQFGHADRWASGLYHSEGYGRPQLQGASCHNRACSTSFGNIKEEILVFDPEGYRLSYAVLEGFPGFVESGVNSWSLTPQGDRTKVDIHMVIKTKGLLGGIMAPMMKIQMGGVLSKAVDDFKHYVETGQPSPRKAKEMSKRAA